MTHDDIKRQAEAFDGWYHAIELFPGFTTRSYMGIEAQWAMIREVRQEINYRDTHVLDVGTMDGMWAFEAEKLGAASVEAIDIWQGDYFKAKERFLFARQVLGSQVSLEECSVEELPCDDDGMAYSTYDVIQCPGVLYHLENPLRALRKMRKVCRPNGLLLLETAVWKDYGGPMARFNSDRGIYNDPSTFWAMNPECLYAALRLTGWEPFGAHSRTLPLGPTLRHCVLCKAV